VSSAVTGLTLMSGFLSKPFTVNTLLIVLQKSK
jgi:hypothetical protein